MKYALFLGCTIPARSRNYELSARKVAQELGIELVDIEENGTVKVRLQGACRGCPGAQMTLKMGVERNVKERVPEVKEVVCV